MTSSDITPLTLMGLQSWSRFFAYRQDKIGEPVAAENAVWLEVVDNDLTGFTAITLPKGDTHRPIRFSHSGKTEMAGGDRLFVIGLDKTPMQQRVSNPTAIERDQAIEQYLLFGAEKLSDKVATSHDIATALFNAKEAIAHYQAHLEGRNHCRSSISSVASLAAKIDAMMIRDFRIKNPGSIITDLTSIRDFIDGNFAGAFHASSPDVGRAGMKAVNDINVCLSIMQYGRASASSQLPITPISIEVGSQLLDGPDDVVELPSETFKAVLNYTELDAEGRFLGVGTLGEHTVDLAELIRMGQEYCIDTSGCVVSEMHADGVRASFYQAVPAQVDIGDTACVYSMTVTTQNGEPLRLGDAEAISRGLGIDERAQSEASRSQAISGPRHR